MPVRMQRNWVIHTLVMESKCTWEWKTVWQLLKKPIMWLLNKPANELLGIYPKDMKLVFTQKPVYKCI